jgi:hypothetical protein
MGAEMVAVPPDTGADPTHTDAAPGSLAAEGGTIVNLDWAGTGAFVAAAAAGVAAPDTFGTLLAALSCVLFAAGCVAFLWAYGVAVRRSRTDDVSIGGVFFLSGSAPAVVRRRLLIPLAVQVVAAIAAASVRPYTVVAFGILTPVFGLGMTGLWGARYGEFAERDAG